MLSMASNFGTQTVRTLFFLFITLSSLVALVSSTTAQTATLLARSGEVLQVLVPVLSEFKEFVECSEDYLLVGGFCIDVFKSALDILIPKPSWTYVNYTCFEIGQNSYDIMIKTMFSENDPPFDAVVGDITISASRLKNSSLTQSYLNSGIVVVTRAVGVSQAFPGVFFAPFTVNTWVVIIVSLALTGLALWLVERNDHSNLRSTESRSEQLKKVFQFITSVLVFFKRESVKNPIAKFVMIAWRLYILLLASSYTASLSSILTVNELSGESVSISDLSNTNLPVGYQMGSMVYDYLTVRHNVRNLVALKNPCEYAHALHAKRVVAIVDEIPYVSLFLAAQSASNCKFAVSSKLTSEGFGFAFFNETLSAAFSVAILNLSESGRLRKLQDAWKLCNFQCPSRVQSAQLDLKTSDALFILLGCAMLLAGIFMCLRKHPMLPYWVWKYVHVRSNDRQHARDAMSLRRFTTRWFSARDYLD